MPEVDVAFSALSLPSKFVTEIKTGLKATAVNSLVLWTFDNLDV